MKTSLFALIAALLLSVSALAQASTFQGTCSNYTIQISGTSAVLQATCLTAAGAGKSTSLTLQGIGNNNGTLVATSGAATFQQSCGSIMVTGNAAGATISALCRTSGGGINASSIALNGVKNNNGSLTY